MSTREVVFLIFDGVKHLDIAGPAEVFTEASRFGADYRLRYVSATGASARTSIGSTFAADSAASEVSRADIVVIPGGDAVPTEPIPPGVLSATRHIVRVSARVASVCTGTFLLAATGALAGKRATTHWAHADLLARIYPTIEVDPDAIFVRDGALFTSAGVTSGIDLALALIESDHGVDLARDVARHLVVYMQRPGGQSQYSAMLAHSRSSQENVRRVVDNVTAHPDAARGLDELARIAGVSARHLARLFRTELDMTPTEFVEQTRLEHAKGLLLSGESVDTTARRTGFHNPETMRRLFVAHTGVPPSQYQQRFATTGRS
ncbi:GlxA family transcriptional regulator [Microbacterium sp. A588]